MKHSSAGTSCAETCGMRASLASILLLAATSLSGCVTSGASGDCALDDDECLAGGYDAGKADGATVKAVAQMNDLTTVFPLAKSQHELGGYLTATSSGAQGQLLPKKLYSPLFPDPTNNGNIGSDVGMVYGNLRVVAIRFDPCFAQIGDITDPSTCDNQIRVVFQSLNFAGGSTSAVDGAVHAFYRVSRADLVAAMREVIALRRAQGQTKSMGPLAPHPLLVKQGVDGAFGQKLGQIVLKYAGEKNLIRFTHLASGNLQTNWFFAGFDVANGKTTPMDVAGLAAHTQTVSFFAGFAPPMSGGFSAPTKTADDISLLVNVDKAKAASKPAAKVAFEAALRIQNPDFHSPNTIDCASCHVAESAQKLMGEDVLKLSAVGDDNLFVADAAFVSAKSAGQSTSVRKQSGINVHMLSYKNDKLMIGARVANETASVVAYVNGTLLK
jgi:hypothetical protein